MLDLRQVSVSFGEAEAVREISLSLEAGSSLALLGPSGCGKTTLLRSIAGLETPKSGEILLDGRPVELGRSAMIFQETPLYPHLTVAQNVGFPLRLKAGKRGNQVDREARVSWKGRTGAVAANSSGGRESEVREWVGQTLDLLRIGHLANRYPAELSGGQRQRVGIARALVRDAELYLFDEPLAHLDTALAREILRDLRKIRADLGLTCVYVTHSREEGFAMGDTVAVMREGKLEQIGSPAELWECPESIFVADFLSGAPLNSLEYRGELCRFRPDAVEMVREGADSWAETFSGLRMLGVVEESLLTGDQVEISVVLKEHLAELDPRSRSDTGAYGDGSGSAEAPRIRLAVPSSCQGTPPERGETVRMRVQEGRLHRFDPITGRRRGLE